jgi:hypothetical protein
MHTLSLLSFTRAKAIAMTNAFHDVLSQILTDHPPSSLLCAGRGTVETVKEYLSLHPRCQLLQVDLVQMDIHEVVERLNNHGMFDFTLVANTIEYVDKATAQHFLARLRDIHTKKMLVVVPIGEQGSDLPSRWEAADFLALGFILKSKLTVDQKPLHVYAFDIDSYKSTPEWLNNKYWANPQLWDKYWW